MFLCMQLWAQEFKVGDAKYLVRPDGKVELKEYKEAQGEVVLPSTVTNPKLSKQYTLASVGKEAFKKSGVTKVVLPESLEANGLGEGAFKDCALLEYVELPASLKELPDEAFRGCKNLKNVNDTSIVIIGNFAYRDCNLPQWSIPPSVQHVKAGAFMGNSDMKTVMVETSAEPVIFDWNVFYGCPLQTVIVDRDIYLRESGAHLQNRPFNNNPALRQVVVGPNVTRLRPDFFEGCPSLTAIKFYKLDDDGTFLKALRKVQDGIYIVMGEETYVLSDFLSEYEKKAEFKKITDKYVNAIKEGKASTVAGNWPDFDIDMVKANINDFHKMIYDMSDVIIDEWSVPFTHQYSDQAIESVANNLLAAITIENGANYPQGLEGWAKMDILRREVPDTARMNDYQILLSLSEKLLKADPDRNVYACGLQLAGLCGSGRWQEAAAYYPKAHRLITENGRYAVPYEITYMRDVINEHGFKAKDPVYSKARKGAQGGQKGYQKSDLLEYFFEKGYQKYKEYRDLRRFRKWVRMGAQIR